MSLVRQVRPLVRYPCVLQVESNKVRNNFAYYYLTKNNGSIFIISRDGQDGETGLQSPGVHYNSNIRVKGVSLPRCVGEGTPEVTLLCVSELLGVEVIRDAGVEDVVGQEVVHHAKDCRSWRNSSL